MSQVRSEIHFSFLNANHSLSEAYGSDYKQLTSYECANRCLERKQ